MNEARSSPRPFYYPAIRGFSLEQIAAPTNCASHRSVRSNEENFVNCWAACYSTSSIRLYARAIDDDEGAMVALSHENGWAETADPAGDAHRNGLLEPATTASTIRGA